jgi:FkbM family methyltransferase
MEALRLPLADSHECPPIAMMLPIIRKSIRAFVRRLGFDLVRIDSPSTMDAALRRLASSHPGIRTLVDVGASDGRWTLAARQHFPDASFLLFEALPDFHGPALQRLAESDRMHVVMAAAGDGEGSVNFWAPDPFGGAAFHEPTGEHNRVVPMSTIDAEVKRRGLSGPFLIKLDTHGFELAILAGATRTLPDTEAIVIEAYNFQVRDEALMFAGMIAHMESFGFRAADLVDVVRRPTDKVLWQMDLVFTRATRPEFARTTYA